MKSLSIDIYSDGADIVKMKESYESGKVSGFTTNPSLMNKAGITIYTEFAQEVVTEFPDVPISFEVFSDDFDVMREEALKISKCGNNVFVKIPITNTKGESSIPLIQELSKEGLSLNVTAILTIDQVKE